MIEMNDKTDKTDKIDTMTDDGPHQLITTMTRMTMTANVGAGIGKSRLDPQGDMMTIHTDEAEHVEIDQPSRSAEPPHEESSAAAPEAPDEPLQERSIVEAIQERQQSKRDSREQHAQLMAKEEAKIGELKATILDLERQEQEIISAIRGGGTPGEIIDKHIKQLHRYNEVKDAGQIILGKVAELEGTTIKKQYEVFGLDSED
ncbi:swi5-like zinc finger protein [Dissophora globulifera]|nr:swi5-like zinc finger protein [Dissophora globulifera]